MQIKVTGAKDIERALLMLSRNEARKIGRAALRKAAKPIVDAARANVPIKTGELRKGISVKVDRVRGNDAIQQAVIKVRPGPYRASKSERAENTYQVGSRRDVYGAFVEFGTSDTPAHPFMRPAWDAEGGAAAIERVGKELGAGLERVAAKPARR